MVTQTNIEIGWALFEGLQAHDLGKWEALLADDFTGSYPGARSYLNGELNKAQAVAYNAVFLPAFSDLRFNYRVVMSDGDRLMYVWDSSGTHDGPLALPTGTVPPTGRQGSVSGTLYVELRDGKIVREETYWNLIELLAQLGAI